MRKIFLILCLLTFSGAAFAEVDYNRTYSPLSVGDTDKYFKDFNSWDSRNLYVPGQPYNQPYDYSYKGGYDPSKFGYRERTEITEGAESADGTTASTTAKNPNQGLNVNAENAVETTQAARKGRGTGYRWGKNPYEIYYNFGATGFKSQGYNSQDYSQK